MVRKRPSPGRRALKATRPPPPAALLAARRLAAPGLRRARALELLRAAARLAALAALAVFAGRLIETGAFAVGTLAAFGAALALAALAGALSETAIAALEARLAAAILSAAGRRLAALPATDLAARPAGALVAGLQRQPQALARLAVGHALARSMLAAGPALAAGAMVVASWHAALMLLAATPVMIVFFVLVGGMIGERAHRQEAALGRLAAQFADRLRTLPTILANHALDREAARLGTRLEAYRQGTMGVLAVAFLNAAVLDFFSSLAIAILAVFLGLGHLGLVELPGFSGLSLWQSLTILVVAPEFFAPFRRYAEQYHAKAEGEAAAAALEWVYAPLPLARMAGGALPAGVLGARGLVLAHAGPVADFTLPQTGLVAVTGASGAGKSSLLRALAGVDRPLAGAVALPPARGRPQWAASDIHIPAGRLADAIAWAAPDAPDDAIAAAAAAAGLLDDALLPGGLGARVAAGGANLSGGQRLRIGVARLLAGSGIAFADEPTAKLDEATAARLRRALRDAARDRLVVVATHDAELAAMAALRIAVGRPAADARRRAA